MFRDLRNYVDDIEGTLEQTSEFLRKLNGARTRLRNGIEKAEKEVKAMKDENKYFAKVRTEIEKQTLKTAKQILFFNVRHAMLVNNEFDWPSYRRALYTAIEDNDTYLFIRRGQGFAGQLKIDINLDKSAGRLDRWAAGIKAYRKVLEDEKAQKARESANKKKKKYKKPVYNPLSASRAWSGIYANREGNFSKFAVTIRQRLELSGALAPFWQLLDKGEVPLRSDRGGYATPKGIETNFVADSEREINDLINAELRDKRKEFYDLFAAYGEFISIEKNRLARLDKMAEELRLDLKIVKNLERKLDLENRDINRNKFEKAVQLIREGLITTGTVEITASGATKRTRLSVSKILAELEY